jgi:hypothetical protein
MPSDTTVFIKTISKHTHSSTNKYTSHKYHNIDIKLDSLSQQQTHEKTNPFPLHPRLVNKADILLNEKEIENTVLIKRVVSDGIYNIIL